MIEIKNRRDWLFAAVLASACVALLFVDISEKTNDTPVGLHAVGTVVSTDNSNVKVNLIVKTEQQVLAVRLTDGPHAGQTLTVSNMLTGKLEFDEFYEPGDNVLVEYDTADGKPRYGTVRGHYRLHLQLVLIAAFGALLLLTAGVTGLKAMLSFVFTSLVLWKLYFPMLLDGYSPIPLGIVLTAILTAVITFSVGGLNRRGISTFSGSMLGVLLTCALAIWFADAFRLSGAVRPFAETLLYSGYMDLNLTDIFTASVFIASSGAVMDLAMDIAAGMDEIHQKNPAICTVDHIRSGLRLGRAVVGTMTTTLLLAYSSSHIMMFMLFQARGLPLQNLLNAPFVAAEILNILVGSFGLVTVAPFTALVAGLVYRRKASGVGT